MGIAHTQRKLLGFKDRSVSSAPTILTSPNHGTDAGMGQDLCQLLKGGRFLHPVRILASTFQ
jgi:hypothetical protein